MSNPPERCECGHGKDSHGFPRGTFNGGDCIDCDCERWKLSEKDALIEKLRSDLAEAEHLVRWVRDQHRGRFLQVQGEEETWVREANRILARSEEKA